MELETMSSKLITIPDWGVIRTDEIKRIGEIYTRTYGGTLFEKCKITYCFKIILGMTHNDRITITNDDIEELKKTRNRIITDWELSLDK